MPHCHSALKTSVWFAVHRELRNLPGWNQSVVREKLWALVQESAFLVLGKCGSEVLTPTASRSPPHQPTRCSFCTVGCSVGTVWRGLTACFLPLTSSARGKSVGPHKYPHAHCEKHSLTHLRHFMNHSSLWGLNRRLTCQAGHKTARELTWSQETHLRSPEAHLRSWEAHPRSPAPETVVRFQLHFRITWESNKDISAQTPFQTFEIRIL